MEIKVSFEIPDEVMPEFIQKAVDKRLMEIKQEGDFVIVTRCKDCKFARQMVSGDYSCLVDHRIAHNEYDFCSYAEPKEIEGESE